MTVRTVRTVRRVRTVLGCLGCLVVPVLSHTSSAQGAEPPSLRAHRVTVVGDMFAKATFWMKAGPVAYPTGADTGRNNNNLFHG